MTTRTDTCTSPRDPRSFETNSKRRTDAEEFHPMLRGYEIDDILQVLEDAAASRGETYLQKRPAFFAAETLRERAKADGW